MRYHHPIFVVCEGTSENAPCTRGPNGAGMTQATVMLVSDAGPKLGRADQVRLPDGWTRFKVSPPRVHSRPKPCSPMASPWEQAASNQVEQMALACPGCSEHMKIEDLVGEAEDASEKGQLQ